MGTIAQTSRLALVYNAAEYSTSAWASAYYKSRCTAELQHDNHRKYGEIDPKIRTIAGTLQHGPSFRRTSPNRMDAVEIKSLFQPTGAKVCSYPFA